MKHWWKKITAKSAPLWLAMTLLLLARVGAAQSAPDAVGIVHGTASVNGVRLHYARIGRGEPVLLLHGFAENWAMWRPTMLALAGRYTLVAPDLRGVGLSDKPVTGYDKHTLAEDVRALMQSMGFRRLSVVGHDIGMMVAYDYAASHPDEVSKLVLLDAALPGIAPWDQIKAEPRVWHFNFNAQPDLPEALTAGREREYFLEGFYRTRAFDPAVFTPAKIDEYVGAYAIPGGMRGGFNFFRAFPQDELRNRELAKRKLEMPVLALGGGSSYGPRIVEHVRNVATNVQGGSIPNCGHWIADEQPEELTRRLLAFLDTPKKAP